ncbi:hypothetical protein U1Q18_040454, partial [Sarracenia purpurea var. burkii]
ALSHLETEGSETESATSTRPFVVAERGDVFGNKTSSSLSYGVTESNEEKSFDEDGVTEDATKPKVGKSGEEISLLSSQEASNGSGQLETTWPTRKSQDGGSETEDALGGVSGIYSGAGTVKGANLDANHGSASESEGDSEESGSESEGKAELDIAKINMVSDASQVSSDVEIILNSAEDVSGVVDGGSVDGSASKGFHIGGTEDQVNSARHVFVERPEAFDKERQTLIPNVNQTSSQFSDPIAVANTVTWANVVATNGLPRANGFNSGPK